MGYQNLQVFLGHPFLEWVGVIRGGGVGVMFAIIFCYDPASIVKEKIRF